MAKCERSFEALINLLVHEQFLSVCSMDMTLFILERVPQNTETMTTLAEQYIEAHEGCITVRSVKKKDVTMKPRSDSPNLVKCERECFYCNNKVHMMAEYQLRKAAQMTLQQTAARAVQDL